MVSAKIIKSDPEIGTIAGQQKIIDFFREKGFHDNDQEFRAKIFFLFPDKYQIAFQLDHLYINGFPIEIIPEWSWVPTVE